MLLNLRKLMLYLLLPLLLSGCIKTLNDTDGKLLAKVHDAYLYASDISNIIPENISPRDSIAFIRSYVKDWVETKVMIYQAEQNLTEKQLNFANQLDDYRNSLIIYRYETKLIDQNLDTVVTDADIGDYYNSHLKDFELKENIARAVYVIIENDSVNEKIFDKVFKMKDALLFDSLQYYAPIIASSSSSLDTTKWLSFINIQQIIPIETYNRELFLKNNKSIKIVNNRYIYYVKFIDFKIKDDISPLEFKRNEIYNIIISRRKIILAKKVRKDIYNRARQNKEFEIYYRE